MIIETYDKFCGVNIENKTILPPIKQLRSDNLSKLYSSKQKTMIIDKIQKLQQC
jgi:hypothetical protein